MLESQQLQGTRRGQSFDIEISEVSDRPKGNCRLALACAALENLNPVFCISRPQNQPIYGKRARMGTYQGGRQVVGSCRWAAGQRVSPAAWSRLTVEDVAFCMISLAATLPALRIVRENNSNKFRVEMVSSFHYTFGTAKLGLRSLSVRSFSDLRDAKKP